MPTISQLVRKGRAQILGRIRDALADRPAAPEVPWTYGAAVGTDVGLAAPAGAGSGADWELRAFFTNGEGRLIEDPVTGSFNAGVACHLFASGLAKGSYVAAQGRLAGADGEVHCRQEADGSVWVGGRVRTVSVGGLLAPLE